MPNWKDEKVQEGEPMDCEPTIETFVDRLVVGIGSRVELAGRLEEKNRV